MSAACCAAIAPLWTTKTVVTDAGSTKQRRGRAARSALGRARSRVSCRRIPSPAPRRAASRRPSPSSSAAAQVVLTPLRGDRASALALVRGAWERLRRAQSSRRRPTSTTRCSPRSATCRTCSRSRWWTRSPRAANAEQLFSFAAGGFRDFTRIASSPPEMWRDIALANREALLAELDRYEGELAVRERSRRATARGWRRFSRAAPRGSRALEQGARGANSVNSSTWHPRARRGHACACPARRAFPIACCCWPRSPRARPQSHDLLDSDDTRVMLEALQRSACDIETPGLSASCQGVGGAFPARRADLFLGNAGTAFRPLTAVLALAAASTACPACRACTSGPIGDLVDALRRIGARIDYAGKDGFPPLAIASRARSRRSERCACAATCRASSSPRC